MKTSYYKVKYLNTHCNIDSLIVKARNAREALANARNICYTGSNFHSPVEVEKEVTFSQKTNGHHSNRAN